MEHSMDEDGPYMAVKQDIHASEKRATLSEHETGQEAFLICSTTTLSKQHNNTRPPLYQTHL